MNPEATSTMHMWMQICFMLGLELNKLATKQLDVEAMREVCNFTIFGRECQNVRHLNKKGIPLFHVFVFRLGVVDTSLRNVCCASPSTFGLQCNVSSIHYILVFCFSLRRCAYLLFAIRDIKGLIDTTRTRSRGRHGSLPTECKLTPKQSQSAQGQDSASRIPGSRILDAGSCTLES